jgi:hypothetical protein
MKARIKGTEDVIDVGYNEHYKMWYRIGTVHFYREDQLEFLYNDSLEEKEKTGEESDNIDWEHRRYEVAKEAMLRMIDPNVLTQKYCVMAVNAVEFANALIEELKEARRPK